MVHQKSTKKTKKAPSVSPRFNASDYDVTLQSRDQVLFKVHKKYLEMNSNGFAAPAATVSTPDELVTLTESSSVLDILLRYIYPGPQPDLGKLKFYVLAGVAEAAQKYEVWPAMEVTTMHMLQAAPRHGLEVLEFASKHDFPDLANKAVKFCCHVSISDAVEKLSPKYLKGFARYIDAWRSALESICYDEVSVFHSELAARCYYWAWKTEFVHCALRASPGLMLTDLGLFHVGDSEEECGEKMEPCDECYRDLSEWYGRYIEESKEIRNMSPFSTSVHS